LNKVVAIHPKFVNGYLSLGYCYYNLGEYFMAAHFRDAQQAFSKTLALDPSREQARQGLQSAREFELLQQKAQAAADNIAAWVELARACMNQPAFYGLAEQALDKAAWLKPGVPEVCNAYLELAQKKKQPPAGR
jgi:cytochrome c-type biogenesis protein CcmH/NrfG